MATIEIKNVAKAFGRVIAPKRMSFPVIRQQNAPQVGVPIKTHTEEIKDFPLVPIRARPDRSHAFD